MEKHFAEFVSRILHPFYMTTYGLLILFNSSLKLLFSTQEKAVSLIVLFIFTLLLPALIIFLLHKKKKISNLNISNRKERTVPFLCVFCCYILCTVVLISLGITPSFIPMLLVGSALSILFLTVISFGWKISAHLTGIGGLCGTIFGISWWLNVNTMNIFIIVILLSGILAYARIVLKEHTLGQSLCGFLLGFFCLFLSNLIFV